MTKRIEIRSATVPLREVYDALRNAEHAAKGVELSYLPNQQRMAVPDPVIIAALVTASGTIIGALITALVAIAASKLGKKSPIVVICSDGARVEVPAGTPPDEIDRLIDRAHASETIEIFIE
jgi:hypothetical protein